MDTRHSDISYRSRQPSALRAQRLLRVYAWLAAGAGLALLLAAALAAVAGLAVAGMAIALAIGVALVAGLLLWARRSGASPHRRIP